eukprot:GHVL01027770.1.p1 GENE.GHVL01027770.1~~GHVL01027770.1.p1  ORF type:complete len:761 (-),score=239.51 GHVL01027770.1:397-2640(-)
MQLNNGPIERQLNNGHIERQLNNGHIERQLDNGHIERQLDNGRIERQLNKSDVVKNGLALHDSGIMCIIICNTPENVDQITRILSHICNNIYINYNNIYGGNDIYNDIYKIYHNDILICTLGRLIDHFYRTNNFYELCQSVQTLYIDECDLSVLTSDKIGRFWYIKRSLPPLHQTIYISSTTDHIIQQLASRHLRTNYIFLNVKNININSETVQMSVNSETVINNNETDVNNEVINKTDVNSLENMNKNHSSNINHELTDNRTLVDKLSDNGTLVDKLSDNGTLVDKLSDNGTLVAYLSDDIIEESIIPMESMCIPNLPTNVLLDYSFYEPNQFCTVLYNSIINPPRRISDNPGRISDNPGRISDNPGRILVFFPSVRICQFFYILFRHWLNIETPGGSSKKSKKSSILSLHSGLNIDKRRRISELFCNPINEDDSISSAPTVLFCTDLVSRGLDFKDISLVIQMGAALSVNDYIHRAGRTGRYGRPGHCRLLLQPFENEFLKDLSMIRQLHEINETEKDKLIKPLPEDIQNRLFGRPNERMKPPWFTKMVPQYTLRRLPFETEYKNPYQTSDKNETNNNETVNNNDIKFDKKSTLWRTVKYLGGGDPSMMNPLILENVKPPKPRRFENFLAKEVETVKNQLSGDLTFNGTSTSSEQLQNVTDDKTLKSENLNGVNNETSTSKQLHNKVTDDAKSTKTSLHYVTPELANDGETVKDITVNNKTVDETVDNETVNNETVNNNLWILLS